MENIITKKCTQCGEVKTLENFTKMLAGKFGRSSWCKSCHSKYASLWNKSHPDRAKINYTNWANRNPDNKKNADHKAGRKYRIKSSYGINEDDYDQMFESQGGKCLICGQPPKDGNRFDIDHSHITGKVRGLLCNKCNTGLGCFKDDIERLKSAITYLQLSEKVE